MQSSKQQVQITAKGEGSKIQVEEHQKKQEIKELKPQKLPQASQKQLLMKLYVYGSCESDQFRHPSKLSESKRPICITNIEKFDLNDDEDDEDSGEKGDKKENIFFNPLYKKSVVKIACGGLHSVVLTGDGKAYTFGCNDEGALGRKGPECVPLQVELDNPVDLVSAGDNHTMFANSVNGIVYFTGNYNYLRGEKMVQSVNEPIKFTTVSLDIRNKNQPIQKLVSGANHTCILINNRIFCRGEPQSFTTGRRINERRKTQNSLTFDGVGLNNVADVWCGGYHTVAKVKKGKDFIYHTWGKNDQGQLGIGNFTSQAFPVEIKNLRGKNIIKVAAGGFFTLFLTDAGEILGCGSNQYGQLGLGQDYEYVPSEPQSEEDSEELKDHVQKLNIEEASKLQQAFQVDGQVAKLSEEANNLNIQSQNDQATKKSEMMPESPQKVQAPVVPSPVIQLKANHIEDQKVESQKKKYEQKNTYIRSVRPLTFSQQTMPTAMITNLSAGAQFGFAWNNITELYSWGFGMNYVLLTGEENQEYEPFKVRNKIINDEIIEDICGGGQHVLYTAYEKTQSKVKPNTALQKRVTTLLGAQKPKLSRKRKN